jgi:hypothetical protein
MSKRYDTSINIEKTVMNKIELYQEKCRLSKQDIILKILSHLIKKSKRAVFLNGPTVGYQARGGDYRKLTLHLSGRELEILKQIRVVTLLSVSYVLTISMDLFGEKVLKRVFKSKWARKIFSNYFYKGSYPGYSTFLRKSHDLLIKRIPDMEILQI